MLTLWPVSWESYEIIYCKYIILSHLAQTNAITFLNILWNINKYKLALLQMFREVIDHKTKINNIAIHALIP